MNRLKLRHFVLAGLVAFALALAPAAHSESESSAKTDGSENALSSAQHELDTELAEAEELANQEPPTDEERERIGELLDDARSQLQMAELLGYGSGGDHEEFRRQIAELEEKIGAEQEATGMFARLRTSLEGFQASLFE